MSSALRTPAPALLEGSVAANRVTLTVASLPKTVCTCKRHVHVHEHEEVPTPLTPVLPRILGSTPEA
jgi:hypothetical protein